MVTAAGGDPEASRRSGESFTTRPSVATHIAPLASNAIARGPQGRASSQMAEPSSTMSGAEVDVLPSRELAYATSLPVVVATQSRPLPSTRIAPTLFSFGDRLTLGV